MLKKIGDALLPLVGLALVLAVPARVPGQDVTVRATVDQAAVAVGQQFTLSVEISGKDADRASAPQLPHMQPFANALGSGSSQNVQIVNGRMTASKTIHFYFSATAAGKFRIEPVSVTVGGKRYESQPLEIEIVPGTAAVPPQGPSPAGSPTVPGAGPAEGDVFLRAAADKRRVFQGEPVVVTYKLYTRLNISQIVYVKLPATAGFWTEEFTLPQQPVPSGEVLEGKNYTVFTIKKMALFPTGPGARSVEPLVMDCEVQLPRRRSQDPFSDFFDDSFFFGRTATKRIQSNPVSIQAVPLPEPGKPDPFSGLVGQFRIRSTVDKNQVKANEAVTLKIVVEGEGNLRILKEPPVSLPSDFEAYPPKVVEDIRRSGPSIAGAKSFEYVLIPRVAGSQDVKPVRLSFFDPFSKQYRTVQTSGLSIDVAPGEGPVTAVPSGLTKEEIRLLGQDIRFIKTGTPSFRRLGSGGGVPVQVWPAVVLPLSVLVGAALFRRHRNRILGDAAYARLRRASRAVRKRFAQAHALVRKDSSKAFYAEVARAMSGFLGDKLNVAETGMLSTDLQRLVRERNVREETVSEYFDCLSVCDLKRFSPADTDEREMRGFLEKAEKAVGQMERELA